MGLNVIDISSIEHGAVLSSYKGLQGVIINLGGSGTTYQTAPDEIEKWSEWAASGGRVLGYYGVIGEVGAGAADAQLVFSRIPKKYLGMAMIFLDWETLGGPAGISDAVAFLEEIQKLSGGTPGVYSSPGELAGRGDISAILKYPYWFAQYANDNPTGWTSSPWHDGSAASLGFKKIIGQQFTSHLQVGQNVGDTDGSYFTISQAEWVKYAGGKVNTTEKDPATGNDYNKPSTVTTTTVSDTKKTATKSGYKDLHRSGNSIFLNSRKLVTVTDNINTSTNTQQVGGSNNSGSSGAGHHNDVISSNNTAKNGQLKGRAAKALQYLLDSSNWDSWCGGSSSGVKDTKGVGYPQNWGNQNNQNERPSPPFSGKNFPWAQCYALSANWWWLLNGKPDYNSIALSGGWQAMHIATDNRSMFESKGWKVIEYPTMEQITVGTILGEYNGGPAGHTEVVVAIRGNAIETIWQNFESPAVHGPWDNTGRGGSADNPLKTPDIGYRGSIHNDVICCAVPPKGLVGEIGAPWL